MVFAPPTDAYAQASAAAAAAPEPVAPPPAMTQLYQHAIGALGTAYYLDAFERIDASGRSTVGWNWAASLCTLHWLVLRRLWNAALVYLAAAEGLALLVFGLGRTWLAWPASVEWGVIGAFVLASVAVPGWFGNGLMHAEVRKRIDRALTSSSSVAEACQILERQAPSRRQAIALAAVQAVLVVGAALAWALLPAQPTGPGSTPEPTVWERPAPTPVATADVQGSETTPADPAPTPAPPAEAPAMAAPPTPALPEATPTAPPPAAEPAAASAPAAPAVAAPPPSAAASNPAPAPKASAPTRPAPERTAPRPARNETATPTRAPAPNAPVGSAPGYYLNVGLFAEEANARRAQARLLNEGLPAFRQELEGPQGRRIRVRVGPYRTRAEADRAASAVRALGLDAEVFQRKG